MSSEECSQRYLIDCDQSNWEWPLVQISRADIKKLMGAALEISVRFFFANFTYTFGGEIYKQMFGGPIGARLTMCVARLVMQQWRDEMKEILKKSEMKELLNKIYVDDNRAIIQKLQHGVRFNESKKIFEYDSQWEKEDESLSIEELTV